MPFIDDRITDILASGVEETAVVIVCGDNCDSVIQTLTAQGAEVDKAAIDLGILRAVVDEDKLEALKTAEGVESIEPDEEVRAQ